MGQTTKKPTTNHNTIKSFNKFDMVITTSKKITQILYERENDTT